MRISRRRLATPLLAALVALPCSALVTAAPAQAAVQVLSPVVPAATQHQQILDGLNAQRAAVGAPALTIDPTLETVAQNWSDVLGQGDGMKHNPNLSTLLSDFPQWGEIVATADMGNADTHGLENGDLAVTSWMGSAPHKAVLLDPKYTSVGIGLVYTTLYTGGRTVWRSYWVADFGSPRRTPMVTGNRDGSLSYAGIPVHGAIAATYAAAGANSGYLGFPTGTEIGPLRDGGYGQGFAGGSIYWSAATGAQVVRGAIRDRWASLGWETSWLGYPRGSEFAVKGGWAQPFQGGFVYWSPATGAQAVRGSIFTTWGATGYETGVLGFPTTTDTPLVGGAAVQFQGGSVYWSPVGGTHVVTGAIRNRWASQGWETGSLGYPVGDAVTSGGTTSQQFQGGTVSATGTTTVVSGRSSVALSAVSRGERLR